MTKHQTTPDPRSGLDEDGSWTPEFPGQRKPFQPGHSLSTTHGSYAVIRLKPRAQEITNALREQAPLYAPALEITLQAAGAVAARLERAFGALEDADDPAELARLEQDARGWAGTLLRYLDALGMTTGSLLRAGVDLAALAGHRDRLDEALSSLAEEGARIRAEREGGSDA